MNFSNNFIKNIEKLKYNNKYELWIKSGNYFGFIYKNHRSTYSLLKYSDMNNNLLYFDEITNNLNYLKNIYDKSLICKNIVPIFELKEIIYLKTKK